MPPDVESAIKREYEETAKTLAAIAIEYGISKSQVHRIVKRAA